MKEIPLAFSFNNQYAIPAGVAFYSLLDNADKGYSYKLYVLSSDLSGENISKLKSLVALFPNAEIQFMDMAAKLDKTWLSVTSKGHYTKETFYKLLTPSLLPRHEKIIFSDVDVVFLGDIKDSYFALGENEPYYIAGVKPVGKIMPFYDCYKKDFSAEEIKKLTFCGGYVVMNLKEMRKDKLEERFLKCFEENAKRIRQGEQDILNLCCSPKVKYLPCRTLVCSYLYDLYKEDADFQNDIQYSEEELRDAYRHPMQLHYAAGIKPWKDVDCTKSEEWFKYLARTAFLTDYLSLLGERLKEKSKKNFCSRLINKIRNRS